MHYHIISTLTTTTATKLYKLKLYKKKSKLDYIIRKYYFFNQRIMLNIGESFQET